MNGFDALPELMTMDQLAERLGVTHRHARRLVDERRVPFLRVGRFIASTRPRSPTGSTAAASLACGPSNPMRS